MSNKFRAARLTGASLFSLWSIAFGASAVFAQTENDGQNQPVSAGGIDEIVVLARKREESLQDVPISITATSAQSLEERNIDRISDLTAFVPNLVSDGSGSVLGSFGIRGIVSNTRNIGFDSGLGVYIDGVLVVRPNASDQELPDVARVEVLRGPQGTLFGRNTTAGAINIITRDASLYDPEATVKLAAGTDHLVEASAFATMPIVEGKLGFKLSGSVSRQDDYYYNEFRKSKADGTQRYNVRGGFELAASENLSIKLNGSYLNQEDSLNRGGLISPTTGNFGGTPGSALPGYYDDPFTVSQDVVPLEEREIWQTDLQVELGLGEYTLTSISAYGENESLIAVDDDRRPLQLSTSIFADGADQFTQEVRLASPSWDFGDLLIGAYYFWQDADADRRTITGGGAITGQSNVTSKAFSVFASGNANLAERLTLSAGLRYNTEKKSVVFRQRNTSVVPLPSLDADLSRKDNNVSGNASLRYEITPLVNMYASVARGFKSGGFNPDIVGSTDISFGPEDVWSYEAGFKSELLDRKVRLNGAVFYSDYSDLQVSTLVGAAFQIRNAGKATIKGGELELEARPAEFIDLNLGVGYTDATYDEFPGCTTNGGLPVDCAGNRLPYVPKWTVSGGIQLTAPAGEGELTARFDGSYRSGAYFETYNARGGFIPSYFLAKARVGWSTDQFGIHAFAENLFDKTYKNSTFYLAPFDQRGIGYGRPRVVGLEVNWSY